jgi:holliday junction DNA helicase RuvA
MIASLSGTIKNIFPKFIIVEVNGVGYRVEGIGAYLEPGAKVDLFIYTHYTQQDIRLFGFLESKDFMLFEDLLMVPGIGPRSAVALINNIGTDEIKGAILENRPEDLVGKGIGSKTARKIVLELAQRIEKSGYVIKKEHGEGIKKIENEVEEALMGLGYNKTETDSVLSEMTLKESDTTELILRRALNILKQHSKITGSIND